MRALALLVFIVPGAMGAPWLHAVVPDLPGPGPGDEGFALVSDADWDLSGWTVADGEGTWTAPPGTLLEADVPWWVTGDPGLWASWGGPPSVAWTDPDLRLSNGGERIVLLDPDGAEVDAFTWGPDGDVAARSPGLEYVREDGSWVTPRLHRIGESDLDTPTFTVHRLTAYASPDSSHAVLQDLIASATHRLHLHVYAFGHAGLTDALVQAAGRGVDVQMLVDANVVGADATDRARTAWDLARIQAAGGMVVAADGGRYDHHHLKVLVADDAVAVQSENWVPTGVPEDPSWGNRGWGVVVEDDVLADWFAAWMADDRSAWDVRDPDPTTTEPPAFDVARGAYRPVAAQTIEGTFRVTPVVAPDHTARDDPITARIDAATQRVWTQQLHLRTRETNALGWDRPDRWTRSLQAAADRGLDVRVMAAAPFAADDMDNREVLASWTGVDGRSWDHPDLGTLHNKGWILDDAVVVGSLNGNHASRSQNREVALLIEGDGAAAPFAALFVQDAEDQEGWTLPAATVPTLLVLMGLLVPRGRRHAQS